MSRKGGLGKFVLGAGLGAAVSLLFAPKKGTELRKDLKCKLDEFMGDVDKLTVEDIKKEFNSKVEDIKKELKDLDKEKVLKSAKKKGDELKTKADELVGLAKEKGNVVLEEMAKDLKAKTVEVAKDVVNKLEEKDK